MLSRFTYSQKKLVKLFKPLPLSIANAYAYCLVMFALGIVYGPIYPISYLVTTITLVIKWWCLRYGLRHWYSNPPTVDQEMMMTLRWRLGQVIGIALIIQCFALHSAAGEENLDVPMLMFVAGGLSILLYTVIPLGFFKMFERFDQLADTEEADTVGLTFEGAMAKGLPMPHYICPTLATSTDDPEFIAAWRVVKDAGQRTVTESDHNLRYFAAAETEVAAQRTSAILAEYGHVHTATMSGSPMRTRTRSTRDKRHRPSLDPTSQSAATAADDAAPPADAADVLSLIHI